MLEKEITDIKIRETKFNNTYREEFNELKKEIDTLKKEQIEKKLNYELNLILLKEHEDKLSFNNNKIKQLKMANKVMNEEMEKIENQKDTFKASGISKSIINFIPYAFGGNINLKFIDKVSFIQKYIY